MGRLRAIVRSRRAFSLLVRRDLHRRYTQYRLAYLWSLLEPLVTVLVLWFIFSVILGRERPLGYQPFILFLVTGVLPWTWIATNVRMSTRVFVRSDRLVRGSLLPREIWPWVTSTSSGLEFLATLPLFVLFAFLSGHPPTWWLLLTFPLAVLLQYCFAIGLALFFSGTSAVLPDIRRMAPVLIRIGFYMSPIIYSVQRVPEALQPFVLLNPMTAILDLYRSGFWPDESLPITSLLACAALSVLTLLIGIVVFRRFDKRLLREL